MIQTLLVYFLVTIILIGFSRINSKENILFIPVGIFISIILYSLIFGIRYGVGRDFFAYLNSYEFAAERGYILREGEWGFDKLTLFFAGLGLHYSLFFSFIAFIQIYFLSLSFKTNKRLLSYIFMSFMLICTFLSWMNGLRQIIALSIFIYAINFALEKKTWKYFVLILIAYLFHSSAIILLPLYFFIIKANQLIPKIKYQIIFFVLSLLLAGKFNESIFGSIPGIIELFGYSHYSEYKNNSELSLGLGYYIIIILNLFLILKSDKVRRYLNDRKFDTIYSLFFIGCIWNYIFLGSIPLNRPNYYLYGLNFIVVGYYLYTFSKLKHIKEYNFYYILLIVLISLIFLGYMVSYEENTMKFLFFWES